MTIENAKITSTSISMADHGVLCISFGVKGDGWGCNIGQYVNGIGYLGAKEWKGNGSAIVAMMKIMDTLKFIIDKSVLKFPLKLHSTIK